MSVEVRERPGFLGPYRIEERLGAGGMGEVYRAFDDRLRRRVAVKHVLPGRASARSRARFRREAQAVASLSHPAIVQIFDVLEEEDGDWIVMEYVDGPTVARLLEGGPLVLSQILAIGCDVAEGLAEAHEEGVVHRDLKTQNVIVTPKGQAKLLDFGLAKIVDDSEDDSKITVDGEILGTWRAMSPEQVQGLEVGPRSDLFSLGTMIYEMATARSPFLGENRIKTVSRILEHQPLSVRQMRPDVPAQLSDLVDRLLEKSPRARPRSARLVAAELVAIAEVTRRTEAAEVPVLPESGTGTGQIDPSEVSVSGLAAGERRQVTVMSCELGPASGEPLDPEEQLQMMPEFERLVRRTLARYGGHIEPEEAMSMSLTVIFGFPRVHADDPRRAASGALEVLETFLEHRDRFERPVEGRLTVKIGIHTGTAVVALRSGEEHPQLVFGEAVARAADLGSLAEPDTVVVSTATCRLLRGAFTFESRMGSLPGGPVEFYRILEGSEAIPYSEVGIGRLVAQVSREQELEQILERWRLAREGMGQVVLVSGEAGIGKTRLLRSFKGRLIEELRSLIECRCTPLHTNTAFFPLVDFLQRVVAEEDWLSECELTRQPPGSETRSAEAAAEARTPIGEDLPLARFLPRLATVLEGPRSSRRQPLSRAPEARNVKVVELLVALMMEMARDVPVVLVVEDLHWIDPSSLDFLQLLVDQVPTARMLVVLSFRRSYQPPWVFPYPSYLAHVTLTRLHDQEVELLIDHLAEGQDLAPRIRREILQRADGIPLFVEELTRLVLESMPAGAEAEAADPALVPVIPATLEGWLTARLDRLGSAKSVAQVAAALGREFSYELLLLVSPFEESELQRELDVLVKAELLHRRGLAPKVSYTFKHGLLRDAAHESMLRSTRKRHHRRIARVLEQRFPDSVRQEPELLAHHYTEADLPDSAVAWWRRAAENAVRAAHHAEACDHAQRGLRLLEGEWPSESVRAEHEMALRTFLGLSLSAAKGYHAPEVERCYERARELWSEVEKTPALFPILDALVLFFLARSQLGTARAMAEELCRLAVGAHQADFLPAAHWSLGWVHLLEGDFPSSRFHAEEGIAYHATQLSLEANLPPALGLAASTSLGDLSWTLWFLGHSDQARQMSRLSLEVSGHSPDGFTRAFALFRAGFLHVFLREAAALHELAEELMTFADERGFLFFVACGMFLKGQALTFEGSEDEGLALMSEAVDGLWASGRSAGRPRNLALLAEACGRADLVEQGLSLLREASAEAEATGERQFEAEIRRLQGELKRRLGRPDGEVEGHFYRALTVARRQGAKSLELRSAVSLARHLESRGRPSEARDVLNGVCSGFTEGFETADLTDARALLDSLPE